MQEDFSLSSFLRSPRLSFLSPIRSWITQQLMVELFQSSQQNISHHVRSIYEEGELAPESTHKKYLLVRREGNREVKRLLDYYNLEAVNERDILSHAGTISHEMATELAEHEYDKFNQKRIQQKDHLDGDFEKTIKQLTNGKRGKKS